MLHHCAGRILTISIASTNWKESGSSYILPISFETCTLLVLDGISSAVVGCLRDNGFKEGNQRCGCMHSYMEKRVSLLTELRKCLHFDTQPTTNEKWSTGRPAVRSIAFLRVQSIICSDHFHTSELGWQGNYMYMYILQPLKSPLIPIFSWCVSNSLMS